MLLDLYEIVINADVDQVTARLEKYRVKQTAHNFIPQRLTPEEEKAGYSHRLYQRVPVDYLMRVLTVGSGAGYDVHRYIYCLAEQRAEALAKLRECMDDVIKRRRDHALALYDSWAKTEWDTVVKTQPTKQ